MKTKQHAETKFVNIEKVSQKTKPRSLRPMRSMVAIRSFKPKTTVATLAKPEETMERN